MNKLFSVTYRSGHQTCECVVSATSRADALEKWRETHSGLWYELLWITESTR